MALPATAPAGVDPYAYLNFLAQIDRSNNSQQTSQQNRLSQQQQQLAQQAAQQQYAQWAMQQQSQFANNQQQSVAGDRQFQLLMQMLQQQGAAANEAKSANAKRANDISDRDLATRNRLLDYVGQYGQSTLDDVNRENQRQRGADTAALSAAGFLGASPDRMRGADITDTRAYLQNLGKAKDSLLQNAINTDERATNRLSDFQERISDPYPQNNNLSSLAGQIGATIPAAGGGGMINNPYGSPYGSQFTPGAGFAGGTNGPLTYGGPGGSQAALRGFGSTHYQPIFGGAGTATPTPYLARPAAPVSTVRPLSGDQRDSLSQAQNQQQMPWNAGHPVGWSPGTQNPAMTSINGQTMPLNKPMPALGIFGAGVQMAQGGGGYGGPYGYPSSGQAVLRGQPTQSPYYQQRPQRPPSYGSAPTWDDGTAMSSPPATASAVATAAGPSPPYAYPLPRPTQSAMGQLTALPGQPWSSSPSAPASSAIANLLPSLGNFDPSAILPYLQMLGIGG